MVIQKKICMLGGFSVGKTSLVRRFVEGVFSEKYLTTIGVKIDKQAVDVDETTVNLMLWDVAGEDDFANIPASYLRGAHGYLLVVDRTRRSTLETALAIQERAGAMAGQVPFLMLLNKSDLVEQHELDRDYVMAATGLDVWETSAKDGSGVAEAFADLARLLIGAPEPTPTSPPPAVAEPSRGLADVLTMPPKLEPATGAQLLSGLDVLTMRRLPDGRFQRCCDIPEWVNDLFPEAASESGLDPTSRFEFLRHFMHDAERVWSGELTGRLDSGLWAEDQHSDREWGIEASALLIDGQQILVLRYMGAALDEKRRILQRARENLLTQERLEEEVRKRTTDIRSRESEIALRLISAAELRDDDTGAHIRRIGLISAVIAEAAGWPVEQIEDLKEAAPMHDIGKVGIPDRILLAPRALTEEEWAVLKTHTTIGARILDGSDVPLLRMAHEIALRHHERWDGTGYPGGLHGEEIPQSARIVALADVYDALVHDRPYKVAINDTEALKIMEEGKGFHFDPYLFELFLARFDVVSRIRAQVTGETRSISGGVVPVPLT